MKVQVNGEAHELADGASVADLVEAIAGTARGTAVVVDDEVVPRGRWAEHALRDGQHVELITAVQGG